MQMLWTFLLWVLNGRWLYLFVFSPLCLSIIYILVADFKHSCCRFYTFLLRVLNSRWLGLGSQLCKALVDNGRETSPEIVSQNTFQKWSPHLKDKNKFRKNLWKCLLIRRDQKRCLLIRRHLHDWFGSEIVSTSLSSHNECDGTRQIKSQIYSGSSEQIHGQCAVEIQVEVERAITSKLDARSFAPPLRVSTPISRVIDRRLYHADAESKVAKI